jgi:hypothetical protein
MKGAYQNSIRENILQYSFKKQACMAIRQIILIHSIDFELPLFSV